MKNKFLTTLLLTIITVLCFVSLTSCYSEGYIPSIPNDNAQYRDDRKVLIVYFTYSNNTRTMANSIHNKLGGTILEIEPEKPYPSTSYTVWGNSARDERDSDARPKIKNLLTPEEIDQYDTILIGFPIWWYTAPMIIGTFLENYTWSSNVDIYPFFQSASKPNNEYYDNSMAFVRRTAKNANVHEGLYTSYSNTSRINEYLVQNALVK